MKAIWNGVVLAESDETVLIENTHYFPPSALRMEFFKPSERQTRCPWRGDTKYYDIEIAGEQYIEAAWYYPNPWDSWSVIAGHIAFAKGIEMAD